MELSGAGRTDEDADIALPQLFHFLNFRAQGVGGPPVLPTPNPSLPYRNSLRGALEKGVTRRILRALGRGGETQKH